MKANEFRDKLRELFPTDDEDFLKYDFLNDDIETDLEIYVNISGSLACRYKGEPVPCEDEDWEVSLQLIADYLKQHRDDPKPKKSADVLGKDEILHKLTFARALYSLLDDNQGVAVKLRYNHQSITALVVRFGTQIMGRVIDKPELIDVLKDGQILYVHDNMGDAVTNAAINGSEFIVLD